MPAYPGSEDDGKIRDFIAEARRAFLLYLVTVDAENYPGLSAAFLDAYVNAVTARTK